MNDSTKRKSLVAVAVNGLNARVKDEIDRGVIDVLSAGDVSPDESVEVRVVTSKEYGTGRGRSGDRKGNEKNQRDP